MKNRSHFNTAMSGILVLLILSIIILSWVPPVSRDALIHHLAIPKLYLKHGGIYEIPDRLFSYYPMNLDFLYLIPLYFENDIIPKLIHFSFALLTAWLIYSYLLKKTDHTYALLGALLFLSIPINVKLSITAYVDLGLVFFSTASMLLLLKWNENQHPIKYLFVSAIACGLALGTKYNGWISFLLLTTLVPIMFARHTHPGVQNQFKAVGWGGLFFLIALLVFSPWMIRNYQWTRNPVYPLYNRFFQSINAGSTTPELTSDDEEFHQELTPFMTRKLVYGEKWWQTILIPLRIFFQSQDDNPKYFDGKLNPFLLLLPIFTFYISKSFSLSIDNEKRNFAYFSILFLLFVFFLTDMRIRYIAPILPFLTILSIYGLYDIHQLAIRVDSPKKQLLLGSVPLLVVVLFSYNFVYIYHQFHYIHPFSFISGQISRDAYIEQYRPEYATIRYVNKNLSKKARILTMFIGERGYYFDREILFDKDWFLLKTGNSEPAQSGLMRLKNSGITHLLIRNDLFTHWINTALNAKQKERVLFLFQNHVQSVYSKNGYELLKILA